MGGNKVDADNDGQTEWLNGYTFTLPASQELSKSGAFADVAYNTVKTLKTVSRDVHGVENVVFTDTDGKILAAARSGGSTARSMTIAIGEQGLVDIHVPTGTNTGFTVNSSNITVYDLITETTTTASLSLPNGFYRVTVNDLDTYVPESITVTYNENYYDYSLNEYDEAGRLLASYQPLNKLKTEFEYSSLDQLDYTKNPDEGEAWFKYREDGQIRFSQNSKQLAVSPQEFSYTDYDELGRPIESGVLESTSFGTADADATLPTGTQKEQHFTVYDALESNDLTFLASLHADYHYPAFLGGNVAKTSNENTTTYYSYDVYGRVQWIVQDIPNLGVKTIDYNYDPVTGSVLKVDYQKYNSLERYIHRYTYDTANQLTQVETSTDDLTFINQARYFYYETGTLRRTELADNLQGIDYIYNLAGQLKAINHTSEDANADPGKDGTNGFSPDVFSMNLDYYNGDYIRNNTPTPVIGLTGGVDQFNGNIKATTSKINGAVAPDAASYYYRYNDKNWLESASFNTFIAEAAAAPINEVKEEPVAVNTNVVATESVTFLPGFHALAGIEFEAKITMATVTEPEPTGDYNITNLTYDANGNIKSLNRNKQTESGSNDMDELTYTYKTDKNQLDYVSDAVTGTTNANDIKSQSTGNYTYNSIGQLTSNTEEDVSYSYNASGLVTVVQQNSQPVVKFYYNDRGHRVKKESFTNGVLSSTSYYVRDVSGNTLAIYDNTTLAELPIYGNTRLGVHYKASTKDVYQLTDHLGNVRAVVGRTDPQPTSTTDYYPFGMPMPGRQTIGGETYRYAFQGQERDPETGKEAFELRLWDARIGRWLTTDPYREFYSPYLGMGNNPVSLTDPDGGCVFCGAIDGFFNSQSFQNFLSVTGAFEAFGNGLDFDSFLNSSLFLEDVDVGKAYNSFGNRNGNANSFINKIFGVSGTVGFSDKIEVVNTKSLGDKVTLDFFHGKKVGKEKIFNVTFKETQDGRKESFGVKTNFLGANLSHGINVRNKGFSQGFGFGGLGIKHAFSLHKGYSLSYSTNINGNVNSVGYSIKPGVGIVTAVVVIAQPQLFPILASTIP